MTRCFPHPKATLLLLLLSLMTSARAQDQATAPQYALHFKPADHVLGDVHPCFVNGECFLYYLKPKTYESTLVRSPTTDLLKWTKTELTHDPITPDDWIAKYYVLGVFRDPSSTPAAPLYRSFYGHKEGRMASSMSTDLVHWSCAPKDFAIPPSDYYKRRRDPFVFWMSETHEFGCVMTTWMKDRPKETGGAISLATSPDLQHWQDHGPIIDPGDIGEPECPQMFQLGGRWYLLASIYDRAVGQPVYWASDKPLGPWNKKPTGVLDGKDLCAAQIAFDETNTAFLFGWIPLDPATLGKQTWGGHLALPREVYALPDGTLGTRLSPAVAKTLARLSWAAHPDINLANAQAEPAAETWTSRSIAVEFSLKLPPSAGEIRVLFQPLGEVVIRPDHLSIHDLAHKTWASLPLLSPLPAERPLPVRLIIDRDIIELFVNDRFSLCARVPSPVGAGPTSLSFATHERLPAATVSGIRTAVLKAAE